MSSITESSMITLQHIDIIVLMCFVCILSILSIGGAKVFFFIRNALLFIYLMGSKIVQLLYK